MTARPLVALLLLACLLPPPGARADVVADWNEITVNAIALQNPFAQARFAAITHLAVFEAVNAITQDHEPYLGTIAAPDGASAEAAAISAAYSVLKAYFPANPGLDALRASSLAAIPDGHAKDDGIAVGAAAAAAMIALRANDGSAPPRFYMPTSSAPGEWQLTAGCPPGGGILFHWATVAPFGIESSSQFRAGAPPALASSEYRKDYEEVSRVGSADSLFRPPDRTDVAQFYNTVLVVALWNSVARQILAVNPLPLSASARAFALLNMAANDALVTVLETKYYYRLWRPITAVRNGEADGNPATRGNPDYEPLITAPCFPSYPSAHASGSGAARRIIHLVWGNGGHAISLSHPAHPQLQLDYTTLKDIAEDVDDARVYGGIHFRFDQEAGALQGWRIADYVAKRRLRPLF